MMHFSVCKWDVYVWQNADSEYCSMHAHTSTHHTLQHTVLHACIPAHTCLHIHTSLHIHIHTHPLTCTQTNTCTHTYPLQIHDIVHMQYIAHTCGYTLTQTQIQACMYVHNYAQMHIQTYYIYTKYICLCILIHMYVCTHLLACIAWQLIMKCN